MKYLKPFAIIALFGIGFVLVFAWQQQTARSGLVETSLVQQQRQNKMT